jgi:hypothetical protein
MTVLGSQNDQKLEFLSKFSTVRNCVDAVEDTVARSGSTMGIPAAIVDRGSKSVDRYQSYPGLTD